MKKVFSGFYSPSNEKIKNAWTNEKTLFVFDTNVLLNLYTYTEEARNDFFKILEKITDRIWLPYHVGLEYQRNRLNIIKNEKHIFQKFEKYIESIEKTIESQEFKELKLDRRFPELHKKSLKLHEDIQGLLDNFKIEIKKQDEKQPNVRSANGDKIRKRLDKFFDNKVGSAFSKDCLDKIFKEGKIRYGNNIPPGYKDVKKDDKMFTYGGLNYDPQYGDLIIWKQIIEKAKDSNIKSVFFITDDTKEDWWYIIDSRGDKRIGVRAELREEIEREANISLFDIMTTSSFMEDGKKYLELDVSNDSIDEVEKRTLRIILDDETKKRIYDMYNPYQNINLNFDQLVNKYIMDNLNKEMERAISSYKPVISAEEYAKSIKNMVNMTLKNTIDSDVSSSKDQEIE